MNYEAPTIGNATQLGATLNGFKSQLGSDAEIKHGVEQVAYEAPQISAERELDGRLQFKSLNGI